MGVDFIDLGVFMEQILKKPLLRGYSHQEAFFVSIGACCLLIAKSTNSTSLIASIIYSLGLLMLFGVSAFYHRPTWKPKARALLKRFDHGSIFVFIAGTFTPLCMLALPEKEGSTLLLIIWIAAGIGLLQSIFWVHTPKWFSALLYVGIGWLVAPYMPELNASLGMGQVMLIVAGGLFYTVGAVFYAMKKPNFYPGIFGYHELFHLFVVIAAILHFLVIYKLIN